jgi:hypothetical protein
LDGAVPSSFHASLHCGADLSLLRFDRLSFVTHTNSKAVVGEEVVGGTLKMRSKELGAWLLGMPGSSLGTAAGQGTTKHFTTQHDILQQNHYQPYQTRQDKARTGWTRSLRYYPEPLVFATWKQRYCAFRRLVLLPFARGRCVWTQSR